MIEALTDARSAKVVQCAIPLFYNIIGECMKEYIFKRATTTEWQKWLNQWRHDCIIDIIKLVHHDMGSQSPGECTIYLTRTPKLPEQ